MKAILLEVQEILSKTKCGEREKGEERKEELLKSLQEEGWESKFQYFTLRLHGKDVWCW